MKKMSKIFALVMVCAMCMSLMSVSAFANNKESKIHVHIKSDVDDGASIVVVTKDGETYAAGAEAITGGVWTISTDKPYHEGEIRSVSINGENIDVNKYSGNGKGTLNIWIEGNKPTAEEEAAKKAAEEEAAKKAAEEEAAKKAAEEEAAKKAAEEEAAKKAAEEEAAKKAAEKEAAKKAAEEETTKEEPAVEKKHVAKKTVIAEEIEEDIVPLPAAPVEAVEEIEEDIVPLAAAPELESAEELDELFDEEVPLAAVPQTSDSAMLWVVLMLISGTAAAGVTVLNNRKVNG